MSILATLALLSNSPPDPGDQVRTLRVGSMDRTYILHLPQNAPGDQPRPLVLALHPFATSGRMFARISQFSPLADREGFIVAYPDGTGRGMLHWNVGVLPNDPADDVAFLRALLDEVETLAKVDRKRVYVTGYSNGAMMSYRLAAEMPERIAAIATVAGTMTASGVPPANRKAPPVPVLHIHGTEDSMVPYERRKPRADEPRADKPQVGRAPRFDRILRPVDETIHAWAEYNGCPATPKLAEVATDPKFGVTIQRQTFGPGREGSEVVLYRINGGGHVWPGWNPPGAFLGKSPDDLKATDLIWQFFKDHPRP